MPAHAFARTRDRGVAWYPRRMGCVGLEFESQRSHFSRNGVTRKWEPERPRSGLSRSHSSEELREEERGSQRNPDPAGGSQQPERPLQTSNTARRAEIREIRNDRGGRGKTRSHRGYQTISKAVSSRTHLVGGTDRPTGYRRTGRNKYRPDSFTNWEFARTDSRNEAVSRSHYNNRARSGRAAVEFPTNVESRSCLARRIADDQPDLHLAI